MYLKSIIAAFGLLTLHAPQHLDAQEPPAQRQILFLGDSITQAGSYIAFLELYLWDTFPELDLDIVNLGLGSETASGNNEPGHPFPRPDIHERLGRILADPKIDPDLVFFDYGMNDGIYHPLSTERFADYRRGIDALISALTKEQREIIALTPTPFDVVSKRAKSRSSLAPDASPGFPFGYQNAWYGYDQLLMTYGDWVQKRASAEGDGLQAIDLHTPMTSYLHDRRAEEPELVFGDGIHPPVEGHLVMALTILQHLGYNRDAAEKRLTELSGIALRPSEAAPNETTPLWDDMIKRKTMLVNAWLEHIGHMKPHKAKTQPLGEVQAVADELEASIRARLKG